MPETEVTGSDVANLIISKHQDKVFEILLNRPEKRNAINWPMLRSLGEAIEQAERTPGVRVVLIRGEGKGFSAGVDFMALSTLGDMFGENWRDHMMSITTSFQSVLNKVERCALPTIALIHGYALGLGLELALACDIRIVARHSKIGLPETRLGLIPDVGGTTRLARILGPARAKELIMTGRVIDLEQAEQWGLVNAVVPNPQLYKKGEEFAAEIALSAPLAVSYTKRVIDGMVDVDKGLQLEAWAQNHLIQTEDFMNGIQAVLTKTKPKWRGK